MVVEIKTQDQFNATLSIEGIVVIDFFATWCGPCKVIAPLLDQLSKEYESVKFIKVDVDQFSDIADEYDIASMPTILFTKNGEDVGRLVEPDMSGMKAIIDKLLEEDQ